MPDSTSEIKVLEVEWYFPENVVGCFATHLAAQHIEGEFILSFFEPIVPIISANDPSRQAKVARIKKMRVKCVARVVVPAPRLAAFIKVLQDNLCHYQEAMEQGNSQHS